MWYLGVVMLQTDLDEYYKILGLNKSANKNEIRKAFIRLSLNHHPDKIKSKTGRDATPEQIKFYTLLKDAYEILISDIKVLSAKNRINPRDTTTPAPTPAPRPTMPPAAATAPIPAATTHTEMPTATPTATVPPRVDTPPFERAASYAFASIFASARASTRSWWRTFCSYASDAFAPPILERIVIAVLSKQINQLKELLEEYRTISNAEREKNIPKLNWLLVEAATARENEIALVLLEFGADVNHYGEFMKLDDGGAFECYFVDMLVHMDNFALFEQISDRVDFTIYSVGLYAANNLRNPHLNHYPKNDWGGELYIDNPNDEYQHNCRKRLLWCAIFCGWVLENNRPDILIVLKDKSINAYKADINSIYAIDLYRCIADYILRCMATKSFTTERVVDRFLAVNRAPKFWRRISAAQVALDMRVNIYTSSLSGLCCIMQRVENTERLLYFNEMLNVINNDVDPIRLALAWHLRYYWEFGGPALLLITGILSPFFVSAEVYSYIECGHGKPKCDKPDPLESLFVFAWSAFPMYILLATLMSRSLSCGYLEIGGTLETVVNRAAINLVLNQYATQQESLDTRSPFLGFSSRSRPAATVHSDDDVEYGAARAYHRFGI